MDSANSQIMVDYYCPLGHGIFYYRHKRRGRQEGRFCILLCNRNSFPINLLIIRNFHIKIQDLEISSFYLFENISISELYENEKNCRNNV